LKQIVVLSGKGGTGKTTFVASFAALSQNIVVADCDVDAADLHLLLKPEKTEFKQEFTGSKLAFINKTLCVECGECEKACRFNAIKNFQVDPFLCEGCGVCAYICPVNAVVLKEKISGYVFISRTKYGPLIHAKLEIAESNSGKLVTLVKNNAKNVALTENQEIILVDGPPGIGCPVIASLSEANLVIAVTEPTLSGLHDLERILSLTNHFNIPTFIAINMYDINLENYKKIVDFCHKTNVPILGEIPFDPVVVEALVNGKPVVEYAPECKASIGIKLIWEKVLDFLKD